MNHYESMLASAIGGVLTLGLLGAAGHAAAEKAPPLIFCAEQEKCYGVARAGKNACATSTTACSGTAVQDHQKDAWIYVPKGTCEKLVGGALAPRGAGGKK